MWRCGIYYVLIYLFASMHAYGTGWTAEAWSITNTTILRTNNLYAIEIIDVITEECIETNIPAITNCISVLNTIGVDYYCVFPSYTNSTRSFTNVYYESMNPCDYRLLSYMTNISRATTAEVAFAGTTNHIIITLDRAATGCVASFVMNADDIRAYEAYLAVAERVDDVDKTNFYSRVKYFYKGNYSELLAGLKKEIQSLSQKFVDIINVRTNNLGHSYMWTNYYDTTYMETNYYVTNYYASVLPNYELYTKYSNTLAPDGMPTNYLLGGAHNNFPGIRAYEASEKHSELGPSYGGTVTSTATIIKYPHLSDMADDDQITNTIILYNGTATNVVGTNGQVVSVVLVNTNIYPFAEYTEVDYGWKNLTNILQYLVVKCVSSRFFDDMVYVGDEKHKTLGMCYTNEPNWYNCGEAYSNANLDVCYEYVTTNENYRFLYSVNLGYVFKDTGNEPAFSNTCGANYEWYIAKEVVLTQSKQMPIILLPYTSAVPSVTKYNNRAIIEFVGTNSLSFNIACGIPHTSNNFSKVSPGSIGIDFSSAYATNVSSSGITNRKIYAYGDAYEEYFWNLDIDEDYCNVSEMDNDGDMFGYECFSGGIYSYKYYLSAADSFPSTGHGEIGPPFIWVLDYRNGTNGFKYY